MSTVVSPICFECQRLNGTVPMECEAYPTGIPQAILMSEVDHHNPYEGDHGLQYLPIGEPPDDQHAWVWYGGKWIWAYTDRGEQ